MARSIYSSAATAAQLDGKTRIERGFMGSHSDVGGGYSDGDLSDVAHFANAASCARAERCSASSSLMWMIDQAKNANIAFNQDLISARGYNVVSNPIVHDSTANEIGGNGAGTTVGPYFDPGRDFAWANSSNSVNRVNQHLTGMTAAEANAYLAGYQQTQIALVAYLSYNIGVTNEETQNGSNSICTSKNRRVA